MKDLDVGMERDLSKAATFVHFMYQLRANRMPPGQFLQVCNHLFTHDLPPAQKKIILADLHDAIMAENTKLNERHPDHGVDECDQYSAKVRDLCKVAFDSPPETESRESLVVQLMASANEVALNQPVYLGDGVVMAYVAFKRDDYTPEEQAQIIDETTRGFVGAFEDAKTKVQYMREGEDY